jgi:predicted aminopeptidase
MNILMMKIVALLPVLLLGLVMSGCTTIGYYTQAVHGEYRILTSRQPLEKVIANSHTPANVKEKLQLVRQLRTFAGTELKLPVDDSYNKYVDVQRKYVVWDVQAAPEFSLEPKTWKYPFVGRLAYRGFFSEKSARDAGSRLAKQGFDVYVDGVEAFSTLGWFKDPLLSTFMDDTEPELAELLFHELAHKRVFASGDTDFNEAFATTVGQEGARRWLRSKGESTLLEKYEMALARDRQFVNLIMATRARLAKLYAQPSSTQMRREKQHAFDDLRQQYSELKASWGGYAGYDDWFSHDLNNAKLNTVANYYDYVPGFQRLLESNGGDLGKFYVAAERLSKEPLDKRHQKLRNVTK